MKRALLLCLALAAAVAAPGAAQKVTIGVQGVFGDYRETDSSLAFKGSGGGGSLGFSYHKFGADVEFASVKYNPRSGNDSSFTAKQLDIHLRYFIMPHVALEVGSTKRTISPQFAAQDMSAARFGLRGVYDIGPGGTLTLRGNFLPGAKFSGGGSSGFAMELGMGMSVGASNGRYRLTADYAFQRVNRKTADKVPIQQSLAKVGLQLGL